MSNIIEDLSYVIKDIAESVVSSVSYDKTIVCSIIDDSDSKNGHYYVSDGSVRFEAYSENTSYTKDTKVYVLLPQNEWTNKKQIIGKYAMSSGPVAYTSAKDRMYIIGEDKCKEVD